MSGGRGDLATTEESKKLDSVLKLQVKKLPLGSKSILFVDIYYLNQSG